MDLHNRKIRKKLSNYLSNKRVALVGPASSILGTKQGALIDSYDVVVRLNKALPVSNELSPDIGTRTDILYNCMNPADDCGGNISLSVLIKNEVKFVVGAYPPIDKIGSVKLRTKKDCIDFYQKSKNRFENYCYTDKAFFLTLWKVFKLANTGTMTILDLLRFDIKELYITGITFFKGGYIRSYRNYDEKGILNHMKRFNLHKPEQQLNYICPRLLQDKRVKMDPTLKDIVTERFSKLQKSKITTIKTDLPKDTSHIPDTSHTIHIPDTIHKPDDNDSNQIDENYDKHNDDSSLSTDDEEIEINQQDPEPELEPVPEQKLEKENNEIENNENLDNNHIENLDNKIVFEIEKIDNYINEYTDDNLQRMASHAINIYIKK